MTPLVSVVIPTFNRAADLRRALRSVVAQTWTRWEVIIVDNHSTDDTDAVVSQFNDSRMTLLKIHNNGVIAASRNRGIQHAHGEYVAFLDSDDWWTPEKLAESVKRLEQGADVVYHDLFLVKSAGQRWFWRRIRTRQLHRPVFRDLIVRGNALTNSSVVVRRSLLTAINGLAEDVDLVAVEDYDAWLRMSQKSDNFDRIPQTLGYYWAGGGSVSNPRRAIQTLDAIYARYASTMDACAQDRHMAWFPYARGRAHFQLGEYDLAGTYLERISQWRAPILLNLKARWMRTLMRVHRIAVN